MPSVGDSFFYMTSRLATPADANRKVGTRALLLALVLIVPLVIGAVVATVSEWQPAEAWSQAVSYTHLTLPTIYSV